MAAVRKTFTKLDQMGYVKRIPRRELTSDGKDGQWLGNEYDLGGLFKALEETILEAQPEFVNDESDD